MKDISLSLKNVTKIFKKSSFKWQSLKGAFLKGEIFKTFNEGKVFIALKDINLEILKGETFGIIGDNGAGKSTILKLFANILKPTKGEVYINGKTSALIELGAGFHPEISGEENIIINGIIMGMGKREIKNLLPDIVKFAEMEDFIKEPVKIYSSGMYARLGFSIAVYVDNPILLVDEVLSVGDQNFAQKCFLKIRELQKKGKTIVFVSHDLDLVSNICHRVCLLERGKVLQVGSPEEVISYYRGTKKLEPEREEEILRYGDRRTYIEKVEVEGKEGDSIILNSEEEAKFSLYFKNPSLERDLVFGIAFHKEDGDIIYGTNTNIDKIDIYGNFKEGKVTFHLPFLNLVQGNYYIDVAIHSKKGVPYDYWKKALYFKVLSDVEDIGSFRPKHNWILDLK